MANNKYNLSKEYQFDITVTDNTYAGKLALPYVTAAVKSPDTVAKGYVRTIDGLNSKAVISNLGVNNPIVPGGTSNCSFSSGNDTSLTEQVLTLTDYKVNEEICRARVFPTWIGENMDRNGNLPGTFEDFLLSSVAGKAGEQIEKGLWMGKLDDANNSTVIRRGIENTDAGMYFEDLHFESDSFPRTRIDIRTTNMPGYPSATLFENTLHKYREGVLRIPLRNQESTQRVVGTYLSANLSARTTEKFNIFAIMAKYRKSYS